MNRIARKRQAEEALGRDLRPGERITAGSLVTSGASRRGWAALAAVWLVLGGAGVEGLVGPIQAGPVVALAILPSLGLATWFLWRPMYAAVTDRRLICYPLSRLRGTARRPSLTVPLADLCIVGYRSGKYSGTSVCCEVPGRRPLLLHAGREEFAGVDRLLARAGAYAKLDPPYPPARNLGDIRALAANEPKDNAAAPLPVLGRYASCAPGRLATDEADCSS